MVVLGAEDGDVALGVPDDVGVVVAAGPAGGGELLAVVAVEHLIVAIPVTGHVDAVVNDDAVAMAAGDGHVRPVEEHPRHGLVEDRSLLLSSSGSRGVAAAKQHKSCAVVDGKGGIVGPCGERKGLPLAILI